VDHISNLDKIANEYHNNQPVDIWIENKIQQIVKQESIQYPKNVFVLTDGYAYIFHPQHPNRWVFLLTTDYKECIPAKSKVFKLQDFE
jgi:hypothetical protein